MERRSVYNLKETLCNLSILGMRRATQFVIVYLAIGPMQILHRFALFALPENTCTFIMALICVDFFYYWEHRIMHTVPLFWAFHEVHHSSPWFNLSTSYRLNLLDRLLGPLFFAPALLLGFTPKLVLTAFAINLTYQFFLHTQYVGKLGFLEGLINTPSAHRVHHGSNDIYLDKNFGGLFMIWDRLFGTYQPETETVKYGTTTGFISHNPLRVLINGFILLWKKRHTAVSDHRSGFVR
jgi:sterol desaturase/sphingolipid hydroxylase (fatty acid hydroxylase superfamily)